MKIAFVPIDNRPVCYTLPELISKINSDIEFFIPPRNLLGSLKIAAKSVEILDWLENLPQLDAVILSLDTICYGGLIPSRRSDRSFEELKLRLDKLKNIISEKNCKVYAHSSIMRISNNNVNEEEKLYWAQWGKKIFEYSYKFHQKGKAPRTEIPEHILEDYLKTRKRNFKINKLYLNWQKEGLFDTLVFSKDDCAKFGLNVKEATELKTLGAYVKTGADEIPLSLLAKTIPGSVKICPIFLEPDSKHLISNYEDISVEDSVKGQIELCGCSVSDEKSADILLYVNNFVEKQGEIVMKIDTKSYDKVFIAPDRPYMIADVRFANGADNNFVKELLKNKIDDKNFFGYSAWNTTANTLGSLICAAKIKYLAGPSYDKKAFNKLQMTRFLDDWAYQANVRQKFSKPELDKLHVYMKDYKEYLENIFGFEYNIRYSYPWKRLFEVEIEFH